MLFVASECVQDGPIIIDGQKTDGIDSIYKECKKSGSSVGSAYSKSHGKVFEIFNGDFSHLAEMSDAKSVEGGYVTRAGVFSADGIDRGSALLASRLPKDLKGRIADLGAGWGYYHLKYCCALQSRNVICSKLNMPL